MKILDGYKGVAGYRACIEARPEGVGMITGDVEFPAWPSDALEGIAPEETPRLRHGGGTVDASLASAGPLAMPPQGI